MPVGRSIDGSEGRDLFSVWRGRREMCDRCSKSAARAKNSSRAGKLAACRLARAPVFSALDCEDEGGKIANGMAWAPLVP